MSILAKALSASGLHTPATIITNTSAMVTCGSWGQALDPLVHNKGHEVPLLIRDHLIMCYAKTSQRTQWDWDLSCDATWY